MAPEAIALSTELLVRTTDIILQNEKICNYCFEKNCQNIVNQNIVSCFFGYALLKCLWKKETIMDKNWMNQLNLSYEKFHLEESNIKKGNKTIVVKPQIKLLLGWSLFILLLVVAYVFVLRPSEEKPKEVAKKTTQETTQDVVEEEITNQDVHETTVPYEQDAYPELNDFITNYYTAITSCNIETLQSMVTNPGEYSSDANLKKKAEFIKEYTNITVYTKKSCEEGNFVVYVVSNINISGVNSAPYDIHKYYVVNGERGYMINNGELSQEVEDFIIQVTADEDIQKVYEAVNSENEQMLSQDHTIQEQFYDVINKDSQQ